MEPPRATAPPPDRPDPAVTVTEELARLAFVMTPAFRREPIDRPPDRERLLP
jgi:hypothetical protein